MRRLLSIATLYPNAHTPRFGTFVARQLEALAARGDWEVTVINPIGTPPFAPGPYRPLAAAAVDGVEHSVAVHRPRFTLLPKFGGRFNPALIAHTVLPLARRLHAEKPFDLVDAQFFYPDGPAAARIARALGVPLSIKARGADISLWGQIPYARKMMQGAAEQAAGLLSVSAALARDMVAIGLPHDKVTVHYTGLDRERFRLRNRQECRQIVRDQVAGFFDETRYVLACVGALIPRKGQRLVFEALEHLPDTQLLLVGAGPDSDELWDIAAHLAHRRGNTDVVQFLGNIDHDMLPIILSASDAMVLPSASEGLANAWVESLACGTPLVISDAGGARELITAPEAGRIVERTPQAIAAGLREVLAANYAPEAVAAHAARFSWQANAGALAAYYETLLQVSPRALRS